MHPDGTIPLSIASAPWRLPAVHLHYRSTPGLDAARWMDELLDGPPRLRVRGPSGAVALPEPLTGPLLLVAAGTGIAQVLALLEELAAQRVPADRVFVVWYVDEAAGAYCAAELEAALPGIRVEFVNSGRQYDKPADAHEAAAHPDAQAIIAGSPAFVYDACATLCAAGMDPQRIQSDVFEYAPRDGFGKRTAPAAPRHGLVDKQTRGE